MFLESRVRPVRGAHNFTAICLDNVGSLTSHNPIGLHGPVTGIALLYGDECASCEAWTAL
jgi:hypothetical protein